MRTFRFASAALAALTVIALGACASTTGATPDPTQADENRLTTDEIRAANLPNAYELVSRLRRAWLRDDAATGGAPRVYMDNREVGGVEALREIPAVELTELRLLSNDDAVARWGTGVTGSVIVVVRT